MRTSEPLLVAVKRISAGEGVLYSYVRLTFLLAQLREMLAEFEAGELAPRRLIDTIADLLSDRSSTVYQTSELDRYDPETDECHLYARLIVLSSWDEIYGPLAMKWLETLAGAGNVVFVEEDM